MRKTLAAGAACLSIFAMTACGSANASDGPVPKTFAGDWHQVKSGLSGFYMTAEISAGSIQIDLKTRDNTKGHFWLGTFEGDRSTAKPSTFVSVGDQDAMSLEIFASSEKTKKFTYKNGRLSYQFSIMGAETTVYLAKDATHKKPAKKATFTPVPTNTAMPPEMVTPPKDTTKPKVSKTVKPVSPPKTTKPVSPPKFPKIPKISTKK